MTNDINILTNEELSKTNGGADRDKTMTLNVLLPTTEKDTNKVTVYIDGQLKPSLCNIYDSGITNINLKITGSDGIKRVDVKVNDIRYKSYEVNFDNGTYYEL